MRRNSRCFKIVTFAWEIVEIANEAELNRKFKGRKRVLCAAFAVFIIWIVIGL